MLCAVFCTQETEARRGRGLICQLGGCIESGYVVRGAWELLVLLSEEKWNPSVQQANRSSR